MTTPFTACVDIGGTFTDLFLADGSGTSHSIKTPTTPDDLTAGLFEAFAKAADRYDMATDELLAETETLIHGTTIATNAIIEDTVTETALICTDGHRDVLTIREGGKEDPYEWDMDYPEPYIPRSLTFGVEERVSPEGEVIRELDEEDCIAAIEAIRDRDVDAVAVALLWAHQNPAHERRVAELIEAHAPDLEYSLSSAVAPIIREYRRTSATAINASLHGVVDEYLLELDDDLTARGYEGTPLIITANGGVMGIDEVARTPIWMVDAGPTMFPVAARAVVEAELGVEDVIALDMGGTSLDMGVVEGGSISRSREATVEGDHMLGIEKVEITSIGSGGGSIAWVDDGGLLHVGPESAGADPGPACYGRGGERPTVTDAALVLGYLNEDYFLGGEMDVDRAAAERALETGIGDRLGLDALDAAHAVYAAANQNMVSGVREITIERGIDTRRFVLSGGGGALGTHAVPVARELRVEDVVLPRQAGVVSAVGGLTSDVRRDFSESAFTTAGDFDRERVNEVLGTLEDRASSFFERAAIPPERRSLSVYTEARYPNQVWELGVPLPVERVGEADVEAFVEAFNEVHESTYGYRMPDSDVEFLSWRVEATGENPQGDAVVAGMAPDASGATDARHGGREAYFGDDRHDCPAYRADRLGPGATLEGPVFVDADTTTVVVPPGAELSVTERGNYHIRP